MADSVRTATPPVELYRELEERPWAYGLFAAVRWLEAAHSDRPRVGTTARPVDEPFRLGQEPSLQFAPSTLSEFDPGQGGRPPRLRNRAIGMWGPQGALPLHLTEYARDRLRNGDDSTFADFVDLFHHRLLSLFYRAWAQAQPAVSHDRPDEDRFRMYVGALFGIGPRTLRDRDAFPDLAKLFMAGAYSAQTRHAEGLRGILSHYFSVPVEIEEFRGQWLELPAQSVCKLGDSPETGALGQTTVVGARVWDCQSMFRIVVGPLGYDAFCRFLPGEPTMERLTAAVRGYVGDEQGWDVNVILKRNEARSVQLGQHGQLGWTTWLLGDEPGDDLDDMVIYPAA